MYRRMPRWLLWVLGTLAAIVAVLTIVFMFFVDEPLRARIEANMNAQLKGYTVRIGRAHLEPLGRELRQQRDRVVVQLPPANRVQLAEQVHDLGMPTPPQVLGHRQALVVHCLGRKLGDMRM